MFIVHMYVLFYKFLRVNIFVKHVNIYFLFIILNFIYDKLLDSN